MRTGRASGFARPCFPPGARSHRARQPPVTPGRVQSTQPPPAAPAAPAAPATAPAAPAASAESTIGQAVASASPSASPAAAAATFTQPTVACAAGGGTVLSGGDCSDAQAVFDSTNMYRSWHQAPPLTWSVTLAAAAQSYALQLASQKCALIHSGAGPENLMSTLRYPKPDASCNVAVNAWYQEVNYYNFSAPQPFVDNWPKGIGHFTALVWNAATKFGCGMARADVPMNVPGGVAGCKVVVCRYGDVANVASNMEFLKNVKPRV
ncbi:hypothetical protein CHLRE_01g011630v5 [Chlamydomonas reinhardtii]|uniref:SCP domain-containing protein n=1 Tax=Chlamydomonas reinhardtii TaxID=3055 RepID=A0A2K3E5L9_CHLRE|nr:uncharacterized protein CHLRE_01g011630v5 [Chlamydomonas reinhardtii]PNW88037.1 hypothetical protein CHLRE_01g011630v5 [Chlamydomonas reinhardtii]